LSGKLEMHDNDRLVIDASVAIKWLHEEDKTNQALNILDKINHTAITATVPDLIIYEVSNALIYSHHGR